MLNDQLRIYRVNAPVQGKYVETNCYAIRGTSGWAIVDTGLNTEQIRNMWEQFVSNMRIKFTDIKGIFLTHGHADHFGAAGWLQKLSGAPVYISSAEKATGLILNDNFDEYLHLITKYGAPLELISKIRQHLEASRTLRKPMPELTYIEPGTTVYLGDFPYTLLPTPGHTDGHLCYFNEQHKVLLSGDHILPEIIPHLGLYSDEASDPLNTYFQSLHAISNLDCKLVLPAHGETITNLRWRIAQIMVSRRNRLRKMGESIVENSKVYEVCTKVFGTNLEAPNLILAMAETYACLMHLVYKNELQLKDEVLLFFNRC